MLPFYHSPLPICLLLCAALVNSVAAGQHLDIIVQQENGELVVGLGDFLGSAYTIGDRVFAETLLPNYRSANPGFYAKTQADLLPPTSALPSGTNLSFDFMPMTVEQTVSNFLFWDGQDSDSNGLDLDDVNFAQPDNEYFEIVTEDFGGYVLEVGDQLVAGGPFATTAFDGTLHDHPAYLMQNDEELPDAGIYLLSMQVRMTGLDTSEPFFLLFETNGLGGEALSIAETWVEQNIDMLTSPPSAAGDYNGDGLVGLADYTVWRDTLGSTTNLAANGDNTGASAGVIDAADYQVWRSAFGSASPPAAVAVALAVPEPSGYWLATLALILAALIPGRPRNPLSYGNHRESAGDAAGNGPQGEILS